MKQNSRKIAIIGVGNVGSSIAHDIVAFDLADHIILCDTNVDKVWAETLELRHCAKIIHNDVVITGGNYDDCFDSDIVILTASAQFYEGMTRNDFVISSGRICNTICNELSKHSSFKGILVVVTNPMDIMTYLICHNSHYDHNKIIGTGTILDTYRLKTELSCLDEDVWCIGQHGGELFVPEIFLDDYSISSYINKKIEQINLMSNRIMNIKKMTNWGITQATICLVKSILNNEKKTLPISHMMYFDFLEKGVVVGYPSVVGSDGIINNVMLDLSSKEKEKIISIYVEQQKAFLKLEGVK